MDARATYEAGKQARLIEATALEGRARLIGGLRLLVAFGGIAGVGAIVWGGFPTATWYGIGLLVVAFVALVIAHAKVHASKERALAAKRFHERGLDRLDGKWAQFSSKGDAFLTDGHLFADDLDIFGRASLFQLLDATETTLGAARLAALVSREGDEPRDLVHARQGAVKDLAARNAFRERLSAVGATMGDDRPDPAPFLAWAESAGGIGGLPGLPVVAKILPFVTMGILLFAHDFGKSRLLALVPFVLQLALQASVRGKVSEITSAVSAREHGFARYGEMLAALENESFTAPLLEEVRKKLRASGADATREMERLSRILGFLDARNNEVFRIFIAPVLMWDYNCALALDAWRARTGKHVRQWLEALAEVEALASLAGFAFDRPDHAFPELVESPQLVAEGLAHPLIVSAKRVANDVTIEGPGHALVVTGSNMSGKSTLLRAIGVACVLARAGAPVCAKRLVLGGVRVATSMRVRDSLEEGTSRFYAELKKLKLVLACARQAPTLFLLDEILHGTNSRERLIGARAILKELLAKGALGAVSTHDLALGELEQEVAGRVRNVHLEEQVEGDIMTFDYHLRDGVVQSSNALRLMRIVGLDVV